MSQHNNAWWTIYRDKNRLKIRAYKRIYTKNEKYLEKQREWYKSNIVREREKRKNRNKLTRIKIIEFLGGKCVKCGFDDFRALQVDHIIGDGNSERKIRGHSQSSLYWKIIEKSSKGENYFQLLCANCNWIKRHENNELNWEKRIKI